MHAGKTRRASLELWVGFLVRTNSGQWLSGLQTLLLDEYEDTQQEGMRQEFGGSWMEPASLGTKTLGAVGMMSSSECCVLWVLEWLSLCREGGLLCPSPVKVPPREAFLQWHKPASHCCQQLLGCCVGKSSLDCCCNALAQHTPCLPTRFKVLLVPEYRHYLQELISFPAFEHYSL